MAGHSSFSQSVAVIDLNTGTQRNAGRQVIVTPITSGPARQQAHVAMVDRHSSIDKVFLKAVSKENSKKSKTFTLRHVNTTKVSTSGELMKLIKEQLGNDVNDWEDFDVGYVQGTGDRVVTIRSKEDLADIWRELCTPNSKIQLWCDGLVSRSTTKSRKRRRREVQPSDSEPEEDCQHSNKRAKKKTAVQEREEKVQDSLEALKKKYGANYTPMQ